MPSWLIRIAVLAVAYSLVPVMPAAAEGDCSGLVTTADEIALCGETTIKGAGGATVRVVVPMDVPIASNECGGFGTWPCALDTHGTPGAATGIVIAEDRPDPHEGRILWMGRLDPEHGGLWTYSAWAIGFGTQANDGVILPAGTYRLHLVAEAEDATVTLSVPELSGAVTATPSASGHLQMVSAQSTLTADGSQENVYVGGTTLELPVPGLTILSHKIDGTFAGRSGVCVYHGEPAGPDEVAYLPYCPQRGISGIGGPGAFSTDGPTFAFNGTAREQTVWEREPGRWGMGAWHVVAGVVTSGRVLAIAVSL